MFPRAPEFTIMTMGFSLVKFASMAAVSSAVASVHSWTSSCWRSSSVTLPRSNCFVILAAFAS